MKKPMSTTLFLLLTLSILPAKAETLYWGNTDQKPLEVVVQTMQKDLSDGNEEGNQRTSLEQISVRCPTTAVDCKAQSQIVLTIDGLLDDSVKAVRYTFLLEQSADQPWRIIEKNTSQLCYKGRGQQKFDSKPCL